MPTIFAGGLVLKLIEEGYTGYLIRTTNDDHTGPRSVGEGILANERDNLAVADAFGMTIRIRKTDPKGRLWSNEIFDLTPKTDPFGSVFRRPTT